MRGAKMKYTKREVNILDHATEVLKALRSGGLLPMNSRLICTRRTWMGHFTGQTAITTPFTWVKSWALM